MSDDTQPEEVEPDTGAPSSEPTPESSFIPFATGSDRGYQEMPDAPPTAVMSLEEKAARYLVSVHASGAGKVGDYQWNNVELKVGDLCVVEDRHGYDFGIVAVSRRLSPRKPPGCGKRSVTGKVIRKATDEDAVRYADLMQREKEAMAFCRKKVFEEDLPMSVSRVNIAFDGAKAMVYFTSESRVDFRELVRELSAFTRVKIEMRQIGVRDEARMIGGCGPCGAELCCAAFLTDFAPVSIRMAKDQNLSLNPAKISGVCGRLMCCLGYEHANYKELVSRAPKMGKAIKDPNGEVGKVIQLNLLKERVLVVYEDGSKGEFGIEEVVRIPGGMAKAKEIVAQERREKAIAEGRDPDAEEEALKLQRESRAPRPRPERGQRPGQGQRSGSGQRSEQGGRPPQGERPERSERPARGERPAQGQRPGQGGEAPSGRPPREADAGGEGNAENRRRRSRRGRKGPGDRTDGQRSEQGARDNTPRGDRTPRNLEDRRPPRGEGNRPPRAEGEGNRPPREPRAQPPSGEGQKRSRRRRRRPNKGEGPAGGGGE